MKWRVWEKDEPELWEEGPNDWQVFLIYCKLLEDKGIITGEEVMEYWKKYQSSWFEVKGEKK